MPKLYHAAARPRLRSGGGLGMRAPHEQISAAAAFQPLEPRQLLAVSLNPTGWTVVAPPAGAHVIYVSNSTGNDRNDGLSPADSVKSLHHAQTLLRNGSGDQMLLKRGDVWQDPLGVWTVSGRSAEAPVVIGAYGTGPRPLLNTGADSALVLGMTTTPEIDHLAIIGLDFHCDTRDPASPTFSGADAAHGNIGIVVVSRTNGLLIEDCSIRDYGTDISFEPYLGPQQNVVIRRSAILDAYNADGSHSEGLYADGVRGLTLESNVFDHDGWNATVPGAGATIFNHDAYLSNTVTDVVVHDNLFANASSHGLQARSGGDVQDNLFLGNPIGMSYGLVNGSPVTPGGVSGVVNGNVFVGTRDISGQVRGVGIELGNTSPDAQTLLSNNIFTDNAGGGFAAIMLEYGQGVDNPGQAVGINNLWIRDNIVHAWTAGLSVEAGFQPGGQGLQALNHLTVQGNDFQNITGARIVEQNAPLNPAQETWSDNSYGGSAPSSSWFVVQNHAQSLSKWTASDHLGALVANPAFIDPSRTAGTYAGTLGSAATAAAFVAGARQQSSQNWQPQYAAGAMISYERAGFEQSGQAPRNWQPPSPPTADATVSASLTTTTEEAGLTLAVTYTDSKAVDLSSLGSGNVMLVGPRGVKLAATIVNVSGGGGAPAVATYRFAAPAGVWRAANAGKYTLMLQGQQVRSTDGFYSAAEPLAAFKLHVAKAPSPPQVRKIKFQAGTRHSTAQSLSVRFTSDVGSTLTASALNLTDAAGNVISPSVMNMTYNAATHTATWTFPGLTGGALPAGRYRLTLNAAGIADAAGRHLDGNKNGIGGDDFVWGKAILSK